MPTICQANGVDLSAGSKRDLLKCPNVGCSGRWEWDKDRLRCEAKGSCLLREERERAEERKASGSLGRNSISVQPVKVEA